MTLADEDTNSKLTDNAKRAVQGNDAMQVMKTYVSGAIWWPNSQLMEVTPSGGQICNLCKWRHLVAKFATNVSSAICWPNLQLCKWCHVVAKFNPSYEVNFWVRCASGNV